MSTQHLTPMALPRETRRSRAAHAARLLSRLYFTSQLLPRYPDVVLEGTPALALTRSGDGVC